MRAYSALASRIDYERAPIAGIYTRRPLAGFQPRTYAFLNQNYDARAGRDPFAHYLRSGRPGGPWVHPVLRLERAEDAPRSLAVPKSSSLRVVLHGHFHYTDYIGDLMRALSPNTLPCELILTTNSAEKASNIKAALRKSGGEANILVVPNRGRDVGPFLKVLEEAIGSCDLLGHIHGKRALHVDGDFGERWRIFLWQHLIGDKLPMVDIINRAFTEDPTLGLLFPEDPFLVGWEENFDIAQELAKRMDLRVPLPPSIDFPVGTMFWARPRGALASPSSRRQLGRLSA